MSPTTINRLTILGTGVLAMIVFGALCIRHNIPAIEADLAMRAKAGLREQRLGWAEVEVDGRDVILTGLAPDPAARARALSLARVFGVRRVENRLETIEEFVRDDLPAAPAASAPRPDTAMPTPEVSYRTRIAVSDGGVVLEGSVPDEATRRRVVRLAQDLFGIAGVEARLELRPGAPPGWEQAAGTALEIADRLVIGEVVLADTDVSVTGLTGTAEAEQAVSQALDAALPDGFTSTAETGSRQELDAVLRTSPGLAARLAARDEQTRGGAIRDVESIDATECETTFRATLGARRVLFATGSDELTAPSERLLEELTMVLKLCPQARLVIEGHTDDQGLVENNLELSQRRAEAVMQFFVVRGISLSRLSARGYGEEQPLVENRTAADRARNRRIEFVFES